jgi:hypothetical protein
MQMIAPRVKRAFLDGDLLSEYMTQVELLGNVIASAGFGLVLVRSNRQIVCANDAAEKLMRASSGLRCEHGCICSKDFMARLDRYDMIFDAVGKSSFAVCRPLLAPGGTYVSTLPALNLFFWSGVHDCRNFR